jgi:hypothetical protein
LSQQSGSSLIERDLSHFGKTSQVVNPGRQFLHFTNEDRLESFFDSLLTEKKAMHIPFGPH